MNDGSEAVRRLAAPALRPSEYTAALIQVLQADAGRIRGTHVLEIGSGSGVVLAALGALGAASVCGVDIEQDAVDAGSLLLRRLGHAAEFHCGDMWLPIAGRRFDLIVANLPHFPMEPVPISGRLPTWSAGGADGRRLLDGFIKGLPVHLSSGGRAVITHNGFVGLERSQDLARAHGLVTAVRLTVLVYIAEEKVARMTPSVLRAEEGRALHRYGPYTFGELHIVEIRYAAS
jgi:methylase of polypeptide subunit release factors